MKNEILREISGLNNINQEIDVVKKDICHLKSEFSGMINQFNSLSNEFNNYKENIRVSSIDENGETECYPGSTIKLPYINHQLALKQSDTYTAYVSKTLYHFFQIENCVGCNVFGGSGKRAIDQFILTEIYKTVDHHFKNEIDRALENKITASKLKDKTKLEKITSKHHKQVQTSINATINKKLGKLNRHMRNLRIHGQIDSELTDNEKSLFKDYESFLKNPSLIDDLFVFDGEKTDEEEESDAAIKSNLNQVNKQVKEDASKKRVRKDLLMKVKLRKVLIQTMNTLKNLCQKEIKRRYQNRTGNSFSFKVLLFFKILFYRFFLNLKIHRFSFV